MSFAVPIIWLEQNDHVISDCYSVWQMFWAIPLKARKQINMLVFHRHSDNYHMLTVFLCPSCFDHRRHWWKCDRRNTWLYWSWFATTTIIWQHSLSFRNWNSSKSQGNSQTLGVRDGICWHKKLKFLYFARSASTMLGHIKYCCFTCEWNCTVVPKNPTTSRTGHVANVWYQSMWSNSMLAD